MTDQTISLTIEGMHCAGCAERVARALEDVDGVAEARVDLRAARAEVAGSGLDPERLAEAVAVAGYTAAAEGS